MEGKGIGEVKQEKEESIRMIKERNAAVKRVKSHFFSTPINSNNDDE